MVKSESKNESKSRAKSSKTQMLVNYVPGEECRVAIVEDGKLEEFTSEKFANQSRVGNIYVGKVINVEPAIQAAFVDFGVGDNGFLHVSDLHPRYFPGESDDATEQVGHKTPRRERPPIQAALRRGDEVFVQVLKEGVGTKGPTLTSYLSIPGRFLVMMPQMDKVGVSRKVEDEEQRRKMREILDQLDLPEGFGFILRTAGLERTKMELKRDLAYLVRLYKDMERRRAQGDKPRLLYAESDLLVRALRDQLTTDVDEIIIDNEQALQRASRFLKIVAPRTSTKLLHYPGKTPIYHAFAVEEQIAHINAREVPLPSGGRLVIDQTEALVAIDVNSGKSRDSRDAEQNAFQTNMEAVDEICRQLRLRDQGGIVINDLIDMRSLSHRKEIESRFRERLKRDRARTTISTISQFGILEMTRQRMRPSAESIHFADCPTCRGRGLVQKPESVTGDALRELAALLDVDKVGRVELVVSPRVAGELLSAKRHLLGRIERTSGKRVDVRVSEGIPLDRVTFYAYDPSGADIDLTQPLPRKRPAELIVVEEPADEAEDGFANDAVSERDSALEADVSAQSTTEEVVELGDEPVHLSDEELDLQIRADAQEAAAATAEAESHGGGRRRRGRGRGRGRGRDGQRDQGRDPHPPKDQSREPAREPRQEQPRPQLPQGRAPDVRRVETERGIIIMGDHGDEDGAPVQPAQDMDARDQPVPGDDAPASDMAGQGDGHGDGQGEGQGGRRRRRRRGRRGRGGGGGAGGGGGGPGGQGAGAPHSGQAHGNQEQSAEPDSEGEFADDQAGPDAGERPMQDGGANPAGDGERRGGRRRRRGRRGRGRGGQGGQNGGQGGEGESARGGQQSDDRGQHGAQPVERSQPRGPAPASQQPTGPKPRLLYGSRRKLTPAELNKRPKPE
ncbi:MAG: Rne/Rng family ribonuclease [Phycisphaerales bacterium]|nr:Rne/Rng family ribonuclease [Planctomycetota bacterium]